MDYESCALIAIYAALDIHLGLVFWLAQKNHSCLGLDASLTTTKSANERDTAFGIHT